MNKWIFALPVCLVAFSALALAQGLSGRLELRSGAHIELDSMGFGYRPCGSDSYKNILYYTYSDGTSASINLREVTEIDLAKVMGIENGSALYDATITKRDGRVIKNVALRVHCIKGIRDGNRVEYDVYTFGGLTSAAQTANNRRREQLKKIVITRLY